MSSAKKIILVTNEIGNDVISLAKEMDLELLVKPMITTKLLTNNLDFIIKKANNNDSEAWIFTSKNAVKVFNEIKHQLPFQQKKLFAVGSKTAQYFNELSTNIIFPAAENAEALAQLIIQHKIKKALFWCSNLRRPILPEILKQNNIEVEDLIVYETIIQTETINQHYDAIAFLSSAATDSFFNNNQALPHIPLFAIGETTFNTLKNYRAQNVFVADKPNTTLLLQQVKKYFSL